MNSSASVFFGNLQQALTQVCDKLFLRDHLLKTVIYYYFQEIPGTFICTLHSKLKYFNVFKPNPLVFWKKSSKKLTLYYFFSCVKLLKLSMFYYFPVLDFDNFLSNTENSVTLYDLQRKCLYRSRETDDFATTIKWVFLEIFLILLCGCWLCSNPTVKYMFKVNNRKTITRCEICSKLTIKTPERRQWHISNIFQTLL